MTIINNKEQLCNWWERTGGGQDGSKAFIAPGAIISGCGFVTSIESIHIGKKARLYGLVNLKAVDPITHNQLETGCRLVDLVNVEWVNWDLLPKGIHLLNLNKLPSLDDARIPDKSRISGVGMIRAMTGTYIGDLVFIYGLSGLEYFKNVRFGAGGRFTNLKRFYSIEDCEPAEQVLFKFSAPCNLVASHFDGFKRLILQGVGLCKIKYDSSFPRETDFQEFPDMSQITCSLPFAHGTKINCASVNDIDAIKPLYVDRFLPSLIFMQNLSPSIASMMPGWVRERMFIR